MNGNIIENGQAHTVENKDYLPQHPKGIKRGKFVYIYFSSREGANQAIRNFWLQRDPSVIEGIESGRLFVDQMITEGSRTESAPVDPPHAAQGYSHAIAISDNGMPLKEHTIQAIRNLGYEIEDF